MRACVFVVVVTKAGLGGRLWATFCNWSRLDLTHDVWPAERPPGRPPASAFHSVRRPPCKLPLGGPRFLLSKRWLNQFCPSIRPASLSLSFFLAVINKALPMTSSAKRTLSCRPADNRQPWTPYPRGLAVATRTAKRRLKANVTESGPKNKTDKPQAVQKEARQVFGLRDIPVARPIVRSKGCFQVPALFGCSSHSSPAWPWLTTTDSLLLGPFHLPYARRQKKKKEEKKKE